MSSINVKFDEQGLIPAIVQDVESKEVLTLAYMNEKSLQKSIETKETWFYSRSRQELWHKGETSGNTQTIVDIRYDCDQDALVVLVKPNGPACHTGSFSCFTNSLLGAKGQDEQVKPLTELDFGGFACNVAGTDERFNIINALESVIAKRWEERPEGSYTTYLFEEGVDKILKKVGEEASEVIIAAKNRSEEELSWETADLLFHLLVLLKEQNLPLDKVLEALEGRHHKKSE